MFLIAHASSEEKSDGSKNSFFKELEQAFFYYFAKYHMTILLVDFDAKVGREDFFKPKLGMTVYIRIITIMVIE
jgi:hypothetical protein